MSEYQTHRWRGVVALSFVAGAIGLLADRPNLIVLAGVGVLFATYPRLTSSPTPVLELDRRVSDRSPNPGDVVDVTVTLRNAGENTLADLRLVDGVPAALSVVDGTPRRGAALRPGSSVTFEYSIEAKSGQHSFVPATVAVRDITGEHEVETTVSEETELTVTGRSDAPAGRDVTLDTVGRVLSSNEGSGLEFTRTREYRRGDSMSRVDWKRFARSGELTTVEYREERSMSVVLLVDARPAAYRALDDEPNAVVRSVAAAKRLLEPLFAGRNQVGVAAFGREFCWHPPGGGTNQRVELHRLFDTHPAFAPTPPRDAPSLDEQVELLRQRLDSNTQVFLFSPLCDDDIVTAARRLDAYGHAVTAVSPDVTDETTVGERLAATERTARVSTLRRTGIPTVDWGPDAPLESALARNRRAMA
ncbi:MULTISPECIES: DUF58 domain-containing protein [Haloprofundus]|uniref:DUF58 domain-containing protein n=1 Tax=Haloprofundus TaxID=1911573 RepID=UPI000E438FC7|nr:MULTISPECIES: DUF58 domain-containing protein [Haloprofundus]QCJ46325.1 DUF58 domain-containing protein [Haloprofundus sp. MHR1]